MHIKSLYFVFLLFIFFQNMNSIETYFKIDEIELLWKLIVNGNQSSISSQPFNVQYHLSVSIGKRSKNINMVVSHMMWLNALRFVVNVEFVIIIRLNYAPTGIILITFLDMNSLLLLAWTELIVAIKKNIAQSKLFTASWLTS